MKYRRLSRRHFLEGLGATLALPLLPSLMGRAEAADVTAPRFFVASWIPHGALAVENFYPFDDDAGLTSSTLPYSGGHVIRAGKLLASKRTHASTVGKRAQVLPDYDGGAARVSPLLGAYVEDALLAKMNLLRGIDFLRLGGHTRGFLGNFANRDGAPDTEVMTPTIDAVIANSAKFYSDAERPLVKAPVLAATGTHLSTFPTATGPKANPYTKRKMADLHALLFSGVSGTPGQQVDPRVSLVDRVYQDYARLARGSFGPGRRISREDRARLEEYMAGVKTVSDRMRATVAPGCTPPAAPDADLAQEYVRNGEADWEWNGGDAQSHLAHQKATLQLQNQLLINAFLCGTSRMAVLMYAGLFDQWDPTTFDTPSEAEPTRTDAHGMVFHNHTMEDRQRFMVEQHRFFFEFGWLDLVRRMNSIEVLPGVKMLDQALVWWSAESGPSTHSAKSVPALLAGSGAGYFQTGNYLDYTNRERDIRGEYGGHWRAGLPQNRLLANIAQAMGLSPADYELSDATYEDKFPARGGKVPGYGDPTRDTVNSVQPYGDDMLADMSLKLPGL